MKAHDVAHAALLALLVASLVAGVLSPVAAQNGEENATATETPALGEGSNYDVKQLDSSISIVNHRYDEGTETFYVKLKNRGDSTVSVTVTEVLSKREASSSGRFGITRPRVEAGGTRVASISVSKKGGAAVMLTTEESIDNREGVYIAADTGGSLFEGSGSWADVRVGVLASAGVLTMFLLLAAWQYVATEHDDVEDLEVAP